MDRDEHPRSVYEQIQEALAHVVQNPFEAANRQTDLFKRRRVLMEDWAVYLVGGHRRVWRVVTRRKHSRAVLSSEQRKFGRRPLDAGLCW